MRTGPEWADAYACTYWLHGSQLGIKQRRDDQMWYVCPVAHDPIAGPIESMEDAQAAAEMIYQMTEHL